MKKKIWLWLVSVILSLAMIAGLMPGLVSAAKAEEPSAPVWPQITEESITIDTSKWVWKYVQDFTEPEYKGLKVTQYSEPKEHAKSTEAQPLYEVGVIDLYFTALPTAEQRKHNLAGLQCNNGSIVVDTDTINWNGTEKAENWDGFTTITTAAQVNWNNGNQAEYSFSGTSYISARGFIIQSDAGNIKYSYKIRLAEYTEGGTPILKESSVKRNSKQNAEIVFSSSSAGSYWYSVYDTKQENAEIDTSSEGYTLNENNTLSITDLNSYSEKYVYILGKSGNATSNILEVTVPAFTYKIEHELKYLDGFTFYNNDGVPYLGYFYSEYFTDIDGNKITEAVPGDTVKVVFNANGGMIQEQYTLTEEDLIVGYAKAYKLVDWNITGAEVDEAIVSNNTEFSFIMPESNVSVNANLVLSGAKIKFTSNIPAPGIPNSLTWDYYSTFYGYWTSMNDFIIPEGQQEYEDTFKTGLKFRANEYHMPGLDIGAYVLKEIKIFNNGTNLNPSDDVLYDTGFTLQEGDNYEFRFVFRDKAYALITTDSSDPTMGTASASVNSSTLVYEGETVTLTATPNTGYVLKEWQVKDDNGTTIPVTVDAADPNKASFVMTADYSDEITATAVFKGLPANYDAVDAAIAKANALDSSKYTEESFAAVTAAVNAVVRGKTTQEQAEVDAMAEAINDAIDALVLSPAVEAIEAIEDLPAAQDLTLEDKEDVMAAKEAYDALTETEKAKVDPLIVKDLNLAVATIEKLEAEKIVAEQNAAIEALQKQIEELKAQLAKTPGWHTTEDGSKYYNDSQGEKVKGWLSDGGKWYFMDKETGIMTTGWVKDNGKWYFMDKETGIMATGWVKDDGTWYYMNASGAMQTGWLKDGNTWYYLKSSGAMAANEWCEGYWLNANGSWTYQPKGSWKQDSKGWWFGDTSGWYAKSTTQKINGEDYTFDAAGYWVQ